MKLGPRVAIVTTLLMAGVLLLAMGVLIRLRRGELVRDLERNATDIAEALAAGLEPVTPSTARAALEARVDWASAREGAFTLVTLVAGSERPTDSTWASLVDAATAADQPVGRFFPSDIRPVYVMAIPLHNQLPDEDSRQTVAFLGLKLDGRYIDVEVAAMVKRALPFLSFAVLLFGGAVFFLLRNTVVAPLQRLIDAIDAVAKGDLSRALLPEREDEVGSLAARFNAMTDYLRDARREEALANTTRLSLETRLRHSEKLATMGQMAAEIAHEVGTPLSVIGGRARSLARRAADSTEVLKNAEIIATQVDRITKIIRQVLDFSRKSRSTLAVVDVRKSVMEAVEFIAEVLKRQRIEATVHAPPRLPAIPGDPDEIQQVCLNLLMNAVHAMPEGGILSVRLEEVIRRKEGLDLSPPTPYLMLEVADTGAGIPPTDREKIFEAFFTTKDTGEGTGLGLAVSKGIVKDHDGWIEVDDRASGGAIFRVFLPVRPDEALPDQPADQTAGEGDRHRPKGRAEG